MNSQLACEVFEPEILGFGVRPGSEGMAAETMDSNNTMGELTIQILRYISG